MYTICYLLLIFVAQKCWTQDSEGTYKGRYIGDLNTYANQVAGEVYAVDEWTLLMVNFFYNGEGRDTYFWAGENGRSGPQGFIIPDEYGKTNILERYNGTTQFTLTLPGGKRISKIKWVAVFDIDTSNVYGDVYVPPDFEAPAPRTVGGLAGSRAVASQPLMFLDSKTLLIKGFSYDGSGTEVYFWTGVGPQPSPKGLKIPNEHGYLEPLRVYSEEDIQLELPGDLDVFHINWISIYDVGQNRSLASASVPDQLNVPASLLAVHPYKSSLPQCRQLHREYQVSWEVFGNQITIQLAAQIGENEYMSFGISGSRERSAMVGADVAVAWFDSRLQRAMATDYNITDIAPCVQVLGQWRGVCRDEKLNALDSYQVISGQRDNGLTVITYRRSLQPGEEFDLPYPLDAPMFAVWALGALDDAKEPTFHRAYNRRDLQLLLGQSEPSSDCFAFTIGDRARNEAVEAWDITALTDPALRVFQFRVGAAGGARGLAGRKGRGGAAPARAWYVNGQLSPDLQIRRGLQYTFKVYGGNDPHSATDYHPLIITDEPTGGLERLSAAAQGAVRAFAGVHYTRRAKLSPTAAGGLCLGQPTRDPRRDVEFTSFRAYNRTLQWECSGAPADLIVAPNSSWPDLVYYNSFTHPGMGGRIFVVDRFRRDLMRPNSAPLTVATFSLLATLLCQLVYLLQ